MTKRNQRNKSARNTARRNRLATLRAELMLTLENEVKPHHLTYNARKTEQLISEFRQYGGVPYWAVDTSKAWTYGGDTGRDDYVDAVSYAMVHGQSITKMALPST